MKTHFIISIKIISAILCIIMFCSCGNSRTLKTEEITDKITQTAVIIKTDYDSNEDFTYFLERFSPSFTVPGLLEGVIPQGFAYIDATEQYAVSGYYEDEKFPSVLMLIDGKSGEMSSYHPLKDVGGESYFGHAGGMCASEDYIYITSESTCYMIKISTVSAAKSGEALQFENNFKLNTKGSFAAYFDNVLWTGDFIESSDKEREAVKNPVTTQSGETFYAFCEGYILVDGAPAVSNINSEKNGYTPDYMLAIPEQVQGMCLTPAGKMIFSTSYGRKNNSFIYIFENVLESEKIGKISINGKDVDLLACGSENLSEKITALPMAEGIVSNYDGVTVIFESGAEKYRRHGGKYPTDKAFTIFID